CLPPDPRIRYLRLRGRLTTGAKRNLACQEARGEFIVHWDDDDWYPAARVRRQLAPLLDGSAEISGSSQIYFYEAAGGGAWRYQYRGGLPWALGTTLAYRKRFWATNGFLDRSVGEDFYFLTGRGAARISDLSDPTLSVAAIHDANTSPKSIDRTSWSPE